MASIGLLDEEILLKNKKIFPKYAPRIKHELAKARKRVPIKIEGDRLDIDSARLETDRVYRFEYLGAKMVLWKSPDGSVDIYQVID
jgi:hypothetical protein